MTPEEKIAFLDQKCAEISEHFEHVQIMVSWNEDFKCMQLKRGLGNWYARQGLAHEFINEDIAQENARAVSRYLPPPPPDDSEAWKTSDS